MNVTVTTTTVKRARLELPMEVIINFLRSLGAEISTDKHRLQVHQPSYNSDYIVFTWEVGETQESHEVQIADIDDLKLFAGVVDHTAVEVDDDDIPF